MSILFKASEKDSYKHIIKVMSVFGGVQVFQVVIGILKSKFIAVYIGPVGLGEFTLFNSVLSMIYLISSLGIGYSATRQISIENKENRLNEIGKIISIVTKWLLVFSILGTIVTVILSSKISIIIFGDKSKTIQFMYLSSAIVFMVYKGRNALALQGMGHYKKLAKSTLFGSLFGLIVSVPAYFYWGLDAIPFVIVIVAFLMFLTSTFYFKKLNIPRTRITYKDAYQNGIKMVKLGLVMVCGNIIGSIVINSINIFVTNYGSVSDLGLYNAGVNITTGYVGMVFAAMSVELLPRLSSVSYDNTQVSTMVNQQSEILFIVLLPILSIMVFLTPLMIKLLLTTEFNRIVFFVRIMAFTIIFRIPAFTIGYIPIAKGDKKIFFIFNSLIPGFIAISFSIIGYYFFNLIGLAIASVLISLLHFILMYYKCSQLYQFKFSKKVTYHLYVSLITIFIANIFIYVLPSSNMTTFIGVIFITGTLWYSYCALDKLVGLNEVIRSSIIK